MLQISETMNWQKNKSLYHVGGREVSVGIYDNPTVFNLTFSKVGYFNPASINAAL